MKICPRCQLPAGAVGRAIAGSSADRERHGVIAICTRCCNAMDRLPRKARGNGVRGALDRALDDPARYLVRLYPDINDCKLAVGLLGHPAWAAKTLEALGWLPGTD